MNRRTFLGGAAAGAAAWGQGAARPNILWITNEDMGPHLGCYGDAFARTPVLDKLAREGARYTNCWSNAPVCAPARTAIISGMYPPALGAEHMRSEVAMGEGRKMFPQILREGGYYTSNNNKEDYNLAFTGKVWDDSSRAAHWRKRAAGQPFFSVFNFVGTHESQIRTRPHEWKHSFEGVRVPAYHPDTKEVREDWAQYYDNIEEMDEWAGKILAELDADGLSEDTIVIYYSDHGSGMPRSKRWPYHSGLRVPMIVRIPEKWKHLRPAGYAAGGTIGRMVAFVDLAPTALRLAGMGKAGYQQGSAFLGASLDPAREFNFGFRGRMDERYDCVRSATDGRYVYLRQYMPHKIYGQYIDYMFQTPTTAVWKKLYDAGKLNAAQRKFWEEKPYEELYDLQKDRDEVNNLAGDPAMRGVLDKMRRAVTDWMVSTGDKGLLPEEELHVPGRKFDPKKIMAMAELAASRRAGVEKQLAEGLGDADSAVRYWAAMGMRIRKKTDGLAKAMREDASGSVRAVAAEAVGCFGGDAEAAEAARILLGLADLTKTNVQVAMLALNGLEAMGKRADGVRAEIAKLPEGSGRDRGNYVATLKKKLAAGA
jgi:arylsulfatase A-like enzyme